jgi:hypothetical protein
MPAEVAVMTPGATLWAHDDQFMLRIPGKDPLLQAQCCGDPRHKDFLRAIPSSLAAGICEDKVDGYSIPLVGLESHLHERLVLLDLIFERSKFVLQIKSRSTPGRPEFSYEATFLYHNRIVDLGREGLVAWRAGKYHLLTLQQCHAAATCKAFNDLDPSLKSRFAAFSSLYELQQQAVQEGSMVKLERFLQEEKIIFPSTIDILMEDDGVEARPFIGITDVDPQKLKKQFWNHSEGQDVYDIVDGQGRARILLNDETKKVAEVVRQHASGFRGKERDRILRDPRSLIECDPALDSELIGVVGYGARVLGLGYPYTFHPRRVSTHVSWEEVDLGASVSQLAGSVPLAKLVADSDQGTQGKTRPVESFSLDCTYADGTTGAITFTNIQEVDAFIRDIERTVACGEPAVEVAGVSVEASLDLVERCRKAWYSSSQLRRLTLIPASNENAVAYQETGQGQTGATIEYPIIAKGLRPSMRLLSHQMQALGWLQQRMVSGGRGALLADDMGLGKTATILAFGSWVVNSFLAEHNELNGPMLVVCPRVLLNVWKNEVQKFFYPEVFGPVLILYGDGLKAAKPKNKKIQGALFDNLLSLDSELILQHKLVITNYHTLSNYHVSLAKIPWSLVVVDEAQAIKNSNTRTSSAVRCLRSEFRVACTGTPVEIAIDNFWAIMDFVSPGDPLKSLSDFRETYAKTPLLEADLDRLRRQVGYNTSNGLVMRRQKKEVLLHLPKKTVIKHTCVPDDIYAQQFAAVMRMEGKPVNLAFKLAGLTQHPYIDTEDASLEANPEEILRTSPKMRKAMEILRSINLAGDKALIFATRRRAIRFLHAAIGYTFSINPQIIDGDVSDDDHAYRQDTRRAILKKFEDSIGFDVLILSPEVAGVGLTITCANHVIHYGRPWNPAKEAQASDRVYRMGQLKDVAIHYILYVSGRGDTFDQKLDNLLTSRTSDINDFLRPWADEKTFGEVLGKNLCSQPAERTAREEAQEPGPPVDPATLAPENFEAFVALVRRAQGERIVLTPRSHDRGLDVICVGDKKISLVQCKTRRSGIVNVNDASQDLKAGEEHLRSRLSSASLAGRSLESVLAVNTVVNATVRSFLKENDIVLLDLSILRKDGVKHQIDEAKVLACAATRCRSLVQVDGMLKEILKSLC